MTRILAALAAALLACAPAAAQLDTRTIPAASPLVGTERMPAVQGAGCPSKTTPCANVAITPSLISTFLAPTFQARDADLDAIAALTTVDFGRQLLTKVDAGAVRSALGLGSMATQSATAYAALSGAVFTGSIAAPAATFSGAIVAAQSGSGQAQFIPGDPDHTGYMSLVSAAGARQGYFGYALTNGPLIFSSDTGAGFQMNGGPTLVVRVCYSASVCDYAGAGSPAGSLIAGIGSTYRRTDGGAGTTFYVKEAATGAATGWTAK